MADFTGSYFKVPADGEDSQHVTCGRWLKVGATLLAGSCLVLFFIMGKSSSIPTLHSTNAAESTNLLGLSSSMRAPIPAMNVVPASLQSPLTVNSMNVQGQSHRQGLQPLGQNLPYRFRSGNLAARSFFGKLFGKDSTSNPDLYQKNAWEVGAEGEYFSRSKAGWIPCVVQDRNSAGAIMLNVKPGFWISEPNQAISMRKRYANKFFSNPDLMNTKNPGEFDNYGER